MILCPIFIHEATTMSHSNHDELTPDEEELLEIYESMTEDDQAALVRMAHYLSEHPHDIPTTGQDIEQMFEQAKRLQ